MGILSHGGLFAATVFVGGVAHAQETITYRYDARGRLVAVQRSGSVNNGVSATYSYDKADNRTGVNVYAPGAPLGGARIVRDPTASAPKALSPTPR